MTVVPVAGMGRIGLGEAEVDMIVVGEDPQFPVRAHRPNIGSFGRRGAISIGGAAGSSAGTKRTSLELLSPVEIRISAAVLACGRRRP